MIKTYVIKVVCMDVVLFDRYCSVGSNALEAFEDSNIRLPSGAAYEVEAMNTSTGVIFKFEVVKP